MEAALYLIPVTLGETEINQVLPSYNHDIIVNIKHFIVENIRSELYKILEGPAREAMLAGYEEVRRRLGDQCAPKETARIIYLLLNNNHNKK